MPTAREIFIVCVVAAATAVSVTLVLRLVGWGEHSPMAAGGAASVAAVLVISQRRASARSKSSTPPAG